MGKILVGDCRKILAKMPDNSVDCVVTSPPYFGLRDYGSSMQIGQEKTLGEYVDAIVEVMRETRRVLKTSGSLWLNIGDSYSGSGRVPAGNLAKKHDHQNGNGSCHTAAGCKPKDVMGVPWELAFALRADGWYLRQDIIWAKPNPMPESVKDRCTRSHEHVFLLTKSRDYYFDAAAIATKAGDWGTRDRSDGKYHNEGSGLQPHSGLEAAYPTANRRDVWLIPTAPYKEAHFAVFPPHLAELCVLAGCPEGGVVLDPFAGSGTTLAVAKQLGRDYIGIELNKDYADLIRKRVKAGVKLLGGDWKYQL